MRLMDIANTTFTLAMGTLHMMLGIMMGLALTASLLIGCAAVIFVSLKLLCQ